MGKTFCAKGYGRGRQLVTCCTLKCSIILSGRRSVLGRINGGFQSGTSKCCENDKGHSLLVGHHLLYCLLDAVYDPFMLLPYQ
jgi:hypothetical protein